MILSFQQEERLKKKDIAPETMATIIEMAEATARLRFARSGHESQKWFKLSPNYTYAVGQRVHIRKVSGTYLIEQPI